MPVFKGESGICCEIGQAHYPEVGFPYQWSSWQFCLGESVALLPMPCLVRRRTEGILWPQVTSFMVCQVWNWYLGGVFHFFPLEM